MIAHCQLSADSFREGKTGDQSPVQYGQQRVHGLQASLRLAPTVNDRSAFAVLRERKMSTQLVGSMEQVAYSRLATVGRNTLLREVAKLLCGTQISLVIVCSPAGAMVGVITKTDVVQRIGDCLGGACRIIASDVMTGNVTFCQAGDLLTDVLAVMEKRCLVHLPFVDENSGPLGVVNARDALRSLVAEGQHEESLLRNYVMGVGYQ